MRSPSVLAAVLLVTLMVFTARPAQGNGEPAATTHAPGFLPVGDIVTPVTNQGRLAGYVVVKASLEFATPMIAKAAEPWLPKIVDAWVRTMYGLAQRGHFGQGSVDPDMLKKQLLQAAIGTLKGSVPDDVLITQALFTRAN
jgi:hypothetical protein